MSRPELTVTEGTSGLRIEKLRKSYRKRVVIRDVSMELARGEVVALLGPNGSGKTTSFYAINTSFKAIHSAFHNCQLRTKLIT